MGTKVFYTHLLNFVKHLDIYKLSPKSNAKLTLLMGMLEVCLVELRRVAAAAQAPRRPC